MPKSNRWEMWQLLCFQIGREAPSTSSKAVSLGRWSPSARVVVFSQRGQDVDGTSVWHRASRRANSHYLQTLSELRPVPNGIDRNARASYFVENQIWSPAHYQYTDSRLASRATQMRMVFQGLDQRDDPRCKSRCGIGLVSGHVSSNLPKPRHRQGGPDNLYRHSASSSCRRPHAHFGGGSSRSVPHESSHAFICSCAT